MRSIYLDHAATSFPKAPGVAEAMTRYLTNVGGNPGRGSYAAATDAEIASFTLREKLCALFGSPDAESSVFTPGATWGLNLVFKGYLKSGDHVLVSSMEHNAVMRPLNQIPGLYIEKVPCDSEGSLVVGDLSTRIRPQTRLVCLTHASNVCGTLLPVEAVGALCRERGIAFVVDASQTAGHVSVDREKWNADAIVVPGHKGLLGPQGIGAVLMLHAFAQLVEPLVAGGTGSRSNMETQPSELPDKFEAGTQNLPGIYGLLAAVAYVTPRMEALQAEAMRLCGALLDGASRLPNTRILGKQGVEGRVSVVALDFPELDNAMVADRLAREFGIATRCGLHCAPSAHRTLGSFPQGAVRFSLGMGNTDEDIVQTLSALETIVTQRHTFAQG
ncbi:MAG: aminotransferase class V-fold PLP-dependent enzyme [Eubacteriales bacterium]|nr:aminotransferase class V-fold PLP-dependent enzyme [Eubacteriales bacterium]